MLRSIVLGLMLFAGTAQANLITNGGFETGNLFGWATTNLGTTGTCPSQGRDWNVASSNSTGCSNVGSPIYGQFAAYNMLDGVANTRYEMRQAINLGQNITDATFSFDWTAIWGAGSSNRLFTVNVWDATGTSVLNTLFSQNFTGSGNFSWSNVAINATSTLSNYEGQTVAVGFSVFIPDTWTGAAGLALDNVSLNVVTASASEDVPEPSTLGIMGLALLAFRRFFKAK